MTQNDPRGSLDARHAELVLNGKVVADASTAPEGIRRYRDSDGVVVSTRFMFGLSESDIERIDLEVFAQALLKVKP